MRGRCDYVSSIDCCLSSYGWDEDYYAFDDTGQYEGWSQDDTGEWVLDPAYKEYYESIDNSSASKHSDKPTDNAASKPGAVKTSNKEPPHVKDQNKKNSEGKGSNALYIPYGEGSKEGLVQDQYGEWYRDPSLANKLNSNKEGGTNIDSKGPKASKNNDPKPAMPSQYTSRPRPMEYEDGWYEEPSDGQWYNTYDWYEDEQGQWQYDYRMEEYGYVQREDGEWVPGPGAGVSSQDQGRGPAAAGGSSLAKSLGGLFGAAKSSVVPSKGVTDPKANGDLPQNNSKIPNGGQSVAKSIDGFSKLFSSSSEPSKKGNLPQRPADYDDYWYQAEDGNWYNEYDDMGYQFADEADILSVEASAAGVRAELTSAYNVSADLKTSGMPAAKVFYDYPADSKKKKPGGNPRPADYENHFYLDEVGAWRNQYDDMGYHFDDEECYSEKELADAEKDLFKGEPKVTEVSRTVAKPVESVKAVETKKPVIQQSELAKKDSVRSVDSVKSIVKPVTRSTAPSPVPVAQPVKAKPAETKKLPRPADYEDHWYQDFDGNWFNDLDGKGQEYEDDPLKDSSSVTGSDIVVPDQKRDGKNVSFDQLSRGSRASLVREPERSALGRSSPKQRWQWAYSRIVQVGGRGGLTMWGCHTVTCICLCTEH